MQIGENTNQLEDLIPLLFVNNVQFQSMKILFQENIMEHYY